MLLKIWAFVSFLVIITVILFLLHILLRALLEHTIETEQNKLKMAKTDFTYCRGIHCPSRNQCKRYVEGLEAAKETEKEHSWIQNCRHAKLFIHKNGEEALTV